VCRCKRLSQHDLAKRLREGDSRAAEELLARFGERLVRLAERQLNERLGRRLDGQDVVQSALCSFFRREARGEFPIDNSSQLWRLLVRLTLTKAYAEARRHTAAKRDVAAEIPDGQALLSQTLDREPRPDEAAALLDQVDVLLRDLPELHGTVLRMRLEGHSVTELAAALRVSRQTVYRVLQLLQERLAEMASASGI
jgi:RNA polymerase sigma factor (sigma-70 family)